jgi:replication-associated recombination protein RarA
MATEYGILPLISPIVHKSAAIKTVLFYGGTGTGKTSLVHAIATHTGSIFFDLSPSNLFNKNESLEKDPQNIKLTLHMVFKVGDSVT